MIGENNRPGTIWSGVTLVIAGLMAWQTDWLAEMSLEKFCFTAGFTMIGLVVSDHVFDEVVKFLKKRKDTAPKE